MDGHSRSILSVGNRTAPAAPSRRLPAGAACGASLRPAPGAMRARKLMPARKCVARGVAHRLPCPPARPRRRLRRRSRIGSRSRTGLSGSRTSTCQDQSTGLLARITRVFGSRSRAVGLAQRHASRLARIGAQGGWPGPTGLEDRRTESDARTRVLFSARATTRIVQKCAA